jgi:hypothetical protein
MEIADAFTTPAIEAADTNVGGDEEEELRQFIRHIYSSDEIEGPTETRLEDIAVLMFVAGRTYQAANGPIRISMSPDLHNRFLEFLNTQ